MKAIDPKEQINLSKAVIVVVDGSTHSLDVTAQILKGFGAAKVHRFDKLADAQKYLKVKTADLLILDPSIERGAGYDYIIELRRGGGANAYIPMIMIRGHVRKVDVARGRDTGVNFVVAKPLSATVLLQRILWVVKDKRPFVQLEGGFIGPDRRFKFDGPPGGSDGRRTSDLKSPLGDAVEPNMSQEEVDAMIKPQRVAL